VAQRRAAGIVARFLAAALGWIVISSMLLSRVAEVGPNLKVGLDLVFLAFATFTLHSKVLRALLAAEQSDLAYRAASVELIERLSIVGEHRDDLTGGHARRIGRLAGVLGGSLGLSAEECERLELAATLHDLGKVGIPDAILNKAGELTPEERREMETHVAIGARMLDGGSHPLVRTAHLVALTHHENWNGGGYPQGLRGEDIPLVGRIVAVCDVYDALVTARPYKEAWRIEDALAEIRRLSGTKFDPMVVEAFLRVHGDTIPQSVGIGVLS
jgi:putative two-component system response regulator